MPARWRSWPSAPGWAGSRFDQAASIMVGHRQGARAADARARRVRRARRRSRARVPGRARLSGPALVACDSFKGTFGAEEAGAAIARGLRAGGREAAELPVADGGEGTMEVLVAALGGELRDRTVSDPLGRPVEAPFALLPDGETAGGGVRAGKRPGPRGRSERDAMAASTRGTGELIAAAVEAGAGHVLVTVGAPPPPTAAPARSRRSTRRASRPRLTRAVRRAYPVGARRRARSRPRRARTTSSVRELERRLEKLAQGGAEGPARRADDRRGGRAVGRVVGTPGRQARAGRGLRAGGDRLRPAHARSPPSW